MNNPSEMPRVPDNLREEIEQIGAKVDTKSEESLHFLVANYQTMDAQERAGFVKSARGELVANDPSRIIGQEKKILKAFLDKVDKGEL